MSCSDFLASFSEYYDGAPRSPERRAAQEHLESCESCRRYVQVVDRGVSLLRSMPAPQPAPHFGKRLEHRLLHVMEEENARNGSSSAIPVATVLGMTVLLTAVAWTPRLHDRTPEVEIAPIVVSQPSEDVAPFGTARPPFLLDEDEPSPLRVGEGLFDDPASLFYQYSPLRWNRSRGRILRRTGLD